MELLQKIKDKDREAFMQLMRLYGEKLYSRLLSSLGDRALADAAFKDALVEFYNTLSRSGGEDVVEALLNSYADRAGKQLLDSSLQGLIIETASEAGAVEAPQQPKKEAPQPEKAPEPEKRPEAEELPEPEKETEEEQGAEPERGGYGPGFWFAIGGLSLAILALLWLIAGLMMDLGIIPELDLGYSWLRSVAPWF